MTGAETLLRFASWSCQVYCRAEVQRRIRVVPSEICKESPDANTGNCAWIVVLNRGWRSDKVKRHARVNSKMTRKIVANRRSEVVYRAIAAGAALEFGSESPPGSEAFRSIFFWPSYNG